MIKDFAPLVEYLTHGDLSDLENLSYFLFVFNLRHFMIASINVSEFSQIGKLVNA